MCTVTWRIEFGGYQVFFNRDELRSRQRGLAPSEGCHKGRRYLAPTDADAGGTWIAVNELGLTVCLLNLYLQDAPPANGNYRSRGQLVRLLAGAAGLGAVSDRLNETDKSRLRSFSLLAFAALGEPRLWQWDGRDLRVSTPSSMPICSSSFAADRAIASRQQVWHELLANRGHPNSEDHLAYHCCELPEPGPFAPAMRRPDARTVSLTVVEVDADSVAMRYADGPPATTQLGPPISLKRELARARR